MFDFKGLFAVGTDAAAEGEEISPYTRASDLWGNAISWPERRFRVTLSGTGADAEYLRDIAPEVAKSRIETDKSYQISPEIDDPRNKSVWPTPARYFFSILITFEADNPGAAEDIATLLRKVQHYKGTIVELKGETK